MEKVNNIILQLLSNRGINGEKDIEEYLSSSPKLTYDPFLLSGMKEGVDLILENIKNNKNICIYGDYDADGMTSVAILKTVLDCLSDKVSYFVPSRFQDGYGLNKNAIENLKIEGVDLIITVDCGITSLEEVEYAKELNMEIMITDHHSVGENLPDCIVIDPKKDECEYPCDFLAGCGIAFKMAQAIQRKTGLPQDVLRKVLGIVAIGTIGDIVPLIDENRTIVKYGLRELGKNKSAGIKLLSDRIFRNNNRIGSEQISFGIVPHLNAAGRLETAEIGVEFFMEENPKVSSEIVEKLIELNTRRKEIQEQIFRNAVEIYELRHCEDAFPFIVMEDAHEGVTGIVAGKMKDYCSKPVAILTDDGNGCYKGTCRSTDHIDIYMLLCKYSNLFIKFGGHKGACGFTINKDLFSHLVSGVNRDMLDNDYSNSNIKKSFEMEIEPVDVTIELARQIELMEPFGNGNEKPTFLIRNCIVEDLRMIGSENDHMRISVASGDKCFSGIYFNIPESMKQKINKGAIINLIGRIEINRWKTKEEVQVIISEIE